MATADLDQILEARDRRAARQEALSAQYGLPQVSFTMNIAGPVKNSTAIRRAFRLGQRQLLDSLERLNAPVLHKEELDQDTGCEGFYVVDLPPAELKDLACWLEESSELGRLFDLDVLRPDGTKLSRPLPRRCLLCGRPAAECARSRTHTVPQLQARTREILASALEAHDAETAAVLAVRALLYEVCTTPKPGLVDRANNGSHRDMDFFTFLNSASALGPYFAQCLKLGRRTATRPAPCTLAHLRRPGRLAESAMLRSTGGVNTHKGAIYTLGLACGALGRLDHSAWSDPERILAEAAAMAAGSVERELAGLEEAGAVTSGQRFYLQYGVCGIRGEAQAGFPAVRIYGLPILEEGLAQGKSIDEAGGAALLALLAHTADTNMIARGGAEGQRKEAARLKNWLERCPYPDRRDISALDREYMQRNLSPGGSADLLALCYMLHFLKEVD